MKELQNQTQCKSIKIIYSHLHKSPYKVSLQEPINCFFFGRNFKKI